PTYSRASRDQLAILLAVRANQVNVGIAVVGDAGAIRRPIDYHAALFTANYDGRASAVRRHLDQAGGAAGGSRCRDPVSVGRPSQSAERNAVIGLQDLGR